MPECLPVKNTFVHFGATSRRTLRVCQSEPADPIYLAAAKLEHLIAAEQAGENCVSDDVCCDDAHEAAGLTPPLLASPDLPHSVGKAPQKKQKKLARHPSVMEAPEVFHFEQADESSVPDGLIVKNTFLDFGSAGTRSLRSCKSAPADPILPKGSNRGEVDDDFVELAVRDAYLDRDAESMTDTTDDCSTLELDLDLEEFSIRTPELSPRDWRSPVDSLATSVMGTPTAWGPQQQPSVRQNQAALSAQDAPTPAPASPVRLDLASDPAFTSAPPLVPPLSSCLGSSINITLRLAEKGKLGVYFGNSLGGDSLVVHGILGGQAVNSWNQQCMFGNSANKSNHVALGDVLLSVNGKTYWQDMLKECEEKLLLKLTFARMEHVRI